MKVLYFDCFSGISGDMTIASLLDLGVDQGRLLDGLSKLGLDGCKISIEKKSKMGITGTYFNVILDGPHDEHSHEDEHKHDHDHHHEHEHSHEHEHNHRSLKDIESIIDSSTLSERVKDLSKKIFLIVAEAEGKIHGTAPEEVHFHEVGAVDSIIDIVAAAICIEELKPDKIVFSKLPLSRGFVKCQHGLFPLPAPATLEILKGMPVYFTDAPIELVTPTGAAIAKALADEFGDMDEMEVEKVGYGLGNMDYHIPNVLRTILFDVKKKTITR
ncbi:MAG TPA: nickel pincer cofactor biosynthesis protein LarC [Clostridiaceae bacterium]|nr:nickel pincer cofactor biosynthesis protein LarC [Lutispora sp.]HCJ57493.1 nickel pincer cofactor biosynthesis protein LarC [Clostridiaceae bacterium]